MAHEIIGNGPGGFSSNQLNVDPTPKKLKPSVWKINYQKALSRHGMAALNVVADGCEVAIAKFRLGHKDGEGAIILSVSKGPTIDMGIDEVDNAKES